MQLHGSVHMIMKLKSRDHFFTWGGKYTEQRRSLLTVLISKGDRFFVITRIGSDICKAVWVAIKIASSEYID